MTYSPKQIYAATQQIKAQIKDIQLYEVNQFEKGITLSEYELGRLSAYKSALAWIEGEDDGQCLIPLMDKAA